MSKKIGYIRISSIDQNPDRQLCDLELDKIFTDKCSGYTSIRPELQKLKEYVRDDDILYIHTIDRLARNVRDLVNLVKEFTDKKVTVIFVKENLKFDGNDNPMSNMLLTIIGSVAEFERGLIRERQLEGIARAKEKGVYKRKNRYILTEEMQTQIKTKLSYGMTKSRVARELGISRQTLYNYGLA